MVGLERPSQGLTCGPLLWSSGSGTGPAFCAFLSLICKEMSVNRRREPSWIEEERFYLCPREDTPLSRAPRSPETGCDLAKRGALAQTGDEGRQPCASSSGELHAFGVLGFTWRVGGALREGGPRPGARSPGKGDGRSHVHACTRMWEERALPLRITSLQVELLATYVASPPEGQGEASRVPLGLPTAPGQLTQPLLKRRSQAARLPGPERPRLRGEHGADLCHWAPVRRAPGPKFPHCFLPGP